MFANFNTLPLNPPEEFVIELDEHSSVSDDYEGFTSITPRNRQRVILQLPLPQITKRGFYTASTSSNTGNSFSSRVITDYYNVNGKYFTIKQRYLNAAHHFSVCVSKENMLSDEDFETAFMDPFIQMYNNDYSEWHQTGIAADNQYLPPHSTTSEFKVEQFLSSCVYTTVRCPVVWSLNSQEPKMLLAIKKFALQKGMTVETVSNTGDIQHPLVSVIEQQVYLGFMGLLVKPDLYVGFTSNDEAVCATLLGEVKLPSLRLQACYNILTEKTLNDLETHEFEEMEMLKGGTEFSIVFDETSRFATTNVSKVKVLQDVIRKLVTSASHCGVNKAIITTYDDYLLIVVDPNFIKVGYSPKESNESFRSKELMLLNSRHYCIKRSDPLVRLKILAFMNVTDDAVADLSLFQQRIGAYFKATYKDGIEISRPDTTGSQNSSGQSSGDSSKPSSASRFQKIWESLLPPTHLKAGGKEIESSSPSSDAPKKSGLNVSRFLPIQGAINIFDKPIRKLSLDPQLLDSPQVFEFESTRKRSLQTGSYLSQVFVVDSKLFQSNIASKNFFSEPLDNEIVVKVFDPCWASSVESEYKELNEQELTIEYQKCVDRATNEINIYSKLAGLSGRVVPKCFGYATIDDCTIVFNKRYIRPWGPAIFLQYLRKEKNVFLEKKDITKEVFTRSILPAFKKIHSRGVIMGDPSLRNLIFTKENNCMIVDFAHGKVNASKSEIKEEVKLLHRRFGFNYPI